ncbi:small ribosomal subunit protein uS14m [Battus philenor]|uniref:small ribosomal subunit protein uS14m n=1 Tax=Battus philenor TaxID=42288 RepID=UPI0035D11DDE
MNLNNITNFSKFIWKSQVVPGYGFQQVRNKWANWLMIRDAKRRRMSAENFLERTRINAMRRNDVLPVEIRELADKDINKFEMNAIPLRINNRCVITSRPRGIVKEWRMSRIVWRHLADYNKLSGVQRAMWG